MRKHKQAMPTSSPTSESIVVSNEIPETQFTQSNVINKKKIAIFLSLLVVIITAGVLMLKSSEKIELTSYTSEKQGFSINQPKDWVVDELNGGGISSTTFSEPYDVYDTSEDAADLGLLSVEKADASAGNPKISKEDYFALYGNAVSDAVKKGKDDTNPDAEYPLSSSQKEAKVDGHDALVIEADMANFLFTAGENGKKHTALVWVNESLQYTIMLATPTSDKNVGNEWDNILASFKVNQ
ncbi:MAG TPA: PsbP-related protein [Candidatus Saccharibacteria bacterium]|jgi:hypothetical protein|nr:PsbP-related protein [Candidatus Saccharibacteria bacterium]HMT55571.1 PsbP-related protein [Candidatus Saccharibacteria bacterium]